MRELGPQTTEHLAQISFPVRCTCKLITQNERAWSMHKRDVFDCLGTFNLFNL